MADTATGHFVSPTMIALEPGTTSGSFNTQLPQTLPEGTYRFRVVSTSPTFVQGDWMNITVEIFTGTTPTISENADVLTSSAAASYQWYLNGAPINGATSQTYIPTVTGAYQVVITEGACSVMSAIYTYFKPNGINDILEPISIFPNPSSGKFTIKNPNGERLNISIQNAIGQVVLSDVSTTKSKVYQLPQGMYFVKVISADQQKTVKLLFER